MMTQRLSSGYGSRPKNLKPSLRSGTGDAAETIVALADAEQADLIVIGTHGRRGIKRLLMGSVAEAVVC